MAEGQELSEEEYARWWQEAGLPQLRQILFWRWDPIGVDDDFPVTEDEYDRYATTLLSRLRHGIDAAGVADYLLEVERGMMGRRYTEDAALRALGQRVMEWFAESVPHWRERRPDE